VPEGRPSLVLEPDDGTLFLSNFGETFTPNRRTQPFAEDICARVLGPDWRNRPRKEAKPTEQLRAEQSGSETHLPAARLPA